MLTKKEWLSRYLPTKRREEYAKAEIERIETRYGLKSQGFSGMPSSGDLKDLSDLIAEYDEYLQKQREEMVITKKLLDEINDAINRVDNDDCRTLLKYKYIQGETWEGVAEKMNRSVRWATGMHSKALSLIKIPDSALICHIPYDKL